MKKILMKMTSAWLAIAVTVATSPLIAQQSSSTPSTPDASQANPSQQTPLPPVELPENPGNSSAPPAGVTQNSSSLPNAPQPQPAPAQPNGTAIAPPVTVSGGAASKPAGVAIAPPKQRQIRSLLIKLGLIAGAGVAVGTVVGLSAASPGHVPNSPGH